MMHSLPRVLIFAAFLSAACCSWRSGFAQETTASANVTAADVTSALTLRELRARISGQAELSRVKVATVESSTSADYLRSRHINFAKHPDVVNVPQRPKSEPYEDQLLVVVRMVRMGEDDRNGEPSVDMEQVSLVIAKNYLITFQEKEGDILDPVRKRLVANKGIIRKRGPDYLAYVIADTIIDAYYPVLEVVGDRLESLESQVIDNPSPAVLGELNRLKNQLINLRRANWPQRDAINELVRGNHELISDEVGVYLRVTCDHCIQTSEVAEMYREMVPGLMNTYLSSVANRANEVMKVLTIMASLFIPLTFMAGIYGMNFEHMPELKYQYSYAVLWITMGIVAAGMLSFFWRKGWIFERWR